MKEFFASLRAPVQDGQLLVWLGALGIVAGVVLAGIILDRIFISKTMLRAHTQSVRLGLALAKATRKMMLPLSMVIGIILALRWLVLKDPLAQGILLALELVLTILLTNLAVRVATELLDQTIRPSEGGGHPASTAILTTLARGVLYSLGILLMLGQLKIDIAPIITALGVGGLAMALALQSTLTNFFTGLQLLASKRIRVGDFVRLENGTEGTVVNVDWRSTIIQQGSNTMVVVPNTKLADAMVSNTSLSGLPLVMLVPFTVAYGSDLATVETVAIDVAKTIMGLPGGDPNFEPVVRFTTLGESGIQGNLVMASQTFGDSHLLRHECIKALLESFARAGIKIPYPTQVIIKG